MVIIDRIRIAGFNFYARAAVASVSRMVRGTMRTTMTRMSAIAEAIQPLPAKVGVSVWALCVLLPVLWIRIRIRKNPKYFLDLNPNKNTDTDLDPDTAF
jgi:hypothetical protein